MLLVLRQSVVPLLLAMACAFVMTQECGIFRQEP